MKTAIFLVLSLLSAGVLAQSATTTLTDCQTSTPCIHILSPEGGSPAVQITNRQSPGIGLLIMGGGGIGIWSGANNPRGTGVWATGTNGAIALRVQGPMVKPRTAGNLMRFYDPDTGALVAELEFEIVQVQQ